MQPPEMAAVFCVLKKVIVCFVFSNTKCFKQKILTNYVELCRITYSENIDLWKQGEKKKKNMYRKSSKGWLKHFDFILIDLISLHLAFVLSYVCRHGIGNPYKNLLYRNMAFMLTFIDFFVVFLFETLKGVLRRGYYQDCLLYTSRCV